MFLALLLLDAKHAVTLEHSPWAFGWEALVAIGTLVLALGTGALALMTWRLAGETAESLSVSRDAFLADIRAVLADVSEITARAQGDVTNRPTVSVQDEQHVEIRVPLRNVGSGLALLLVPEMEAEARDLARSVTSTTHTSAVLAGEITDMIFRFEFASLNTEFIQKLHEDAVFTVIARCRDMDGRQEIRTEATLVYLPAGTEERPPYTGQWRFGEVKLFHGNSAEPFAQLPRSTTTEVTGGAT